MLVSYNNKIGLKNYSHQTVPSASSDTYKARIGNAARILFEIIIHITVSSARFSSVASDSDAAKRAWARCNMNTLPCSV